jgi:membrane protein CcdC involved in cytochrome C biogenesis
VEYFLFMAVMMVLTSKRVEKRPGATMASFSPPIFTGTVFLYFVFLHRLLIAIVEGVFI